MKRSKHIWTERRLNDALIEPTLAIVEDMKRIDGDILILGAGGKMRHTICVLVDKAMERAGIHKKVIAVLRFHDSEVRGYLEENHVEMIQADLQDLKQLENLPEVPNVIYTAGRKFDTDRQEWMTWGVNSVLPASVGKRYKRSRAVVFSSSNIYPMVSLASGGCTERDKVAPMGEYVQNYLARERIFGYYSSRYSIEILIYRLNSAVGLRYGVLADIAGKIMNQTLISITTPCFNCIWQGSAAEIGVRGLLHASNPLKTMNVIGPEAISVRKVAEEIGGFLDREPIFEGEEGSDTYLNNASWTMEQFGYPAVPADTLIRWQVEWVADGGGDLGLPTYFKERGERY